MLNGWAPAFRINGIQDGLQALWFTDLFVLVPLIMSR